MATSILKGSARFGYTPVGGGSVTHLLAVPLMHRQATDPQTKYEWWSADLTTRELIALGNGVHEITAVIRGEDDPAGLLAMLREALYNGVTLTYRETPIGTAFPVVLLGDQAEIRPDRQMYAQGRYEATVRMRRIDGGDLNGLLEP